MAFRKSISLLIAVVLLFATCGCSRTASANTAANDSKWLFELQFQEMTPEDLKDELLSRGWVRWDAPTGYEGECFIGTLFGTKSTIFYDVSADTGKITLLRARAWQCVPETAPLIDEKIAALGESEWNAVRSVQFRDGTAAAPILVNWILDIRESLTQTGAVLPEDAQAILPSEDDALLEEFEVFDTEYFALNLGNAGRSEGRYQLPNDRYADLSVGALSQENGTAGTLFFSIRLYASDYVNSDGIPLENISVPQ